MSIRYKTIIGIATIEAVMLALLVWNAISILTSSHEDELLKRTETITSMFASSNKDAVLSDDLATLESFVKEAVSHPEIIYTRVLDRDRNILAQEGDKAILARPFSMDKSYSDVNDGVFDSCSLIQIEGTTYGFVEIGFSIDGINSAIALAQSKSLAFASTEMVLTAIFSLVLGVYLTRSINHLRKGTEKVSEGDFGYQIEVTGSDELAAASQAFNEMSLHLAALERDRLTHTKELAKFKFFSDHSNDAHFLIDENSRFRYVNETACMMLGYSKDELLKLSVPDVDPIYNLDKYRELHSLLQKEAIPPIETENKRKDGSTFPSEISVTGYHLQGSFYLFAALRDISERKRNEERIKSSLKEKEILLKEIHHRAKNNMQVISSLLNMQTRFLDNDQAIRIFDESINRIKSMALVHEKLYHSRDLVHINFNDYINTLANELFSFYNVDRHSITLKTDIKDISMSVDTAIPCGLITNELISNSLKHAFPSSNSKGEISISLSKDPESNEYQMIISDTGKGIPKDIDIRNTRSLGMQLVTNLAEHQLHGSVDVNGKEGTEFRIRFSEDNYKKRI